MLLLPPPCLPFMPRRDGWPDSPSPQAALSVVPTTPPQSDTHLLLHLRCPPQDGVLEVVIPKRGETKREEGRTIAIE